MSKGRIIFIAGPTGVGKSEVALALAQKFGGEIVSCDAMQVYQEINIASDKPPAEARAAVRHHLLDIVSVREEFDVARFFHLACAAVADIHGRGKIPVVAGGSGLYMSALLDGIFDLPPANDAQISRTLCAQLEREGPVSLHARLVRLDPLAALKIHPHDVKRILRALMVVTATGVPISQWQKQRQGLWGKYNIAIFALNRGRQELYRRVERRVEAMFARGLAEEVRAVLRLSPGRTAGAIIGIPEVGGYARGEYDLDRARYLMQRNTRHYVKRQLTWLRREQRLQWIDIAEGQTVEQVVERIRV